MSKAWAFRFAIPMAMVGVCVVGAQQKPSALGFFSVVSIRGNDIERAPFDPSKFSHVMYALQNARAVTTNATELAKKSKAFLDRDIYVIPNGIDTDHFQPMKKITRLIQTLRLIHPEARGYTPHLGQQPVSRFDQHVIGFVGELREKKGIKTLLSAYAQVNKTRSTILLIVGTIRTGADKEYFEEFLISNPNSQIIVTGYISPGDLPKYYALIDILVRLPAWAGPGIRHRCRCRTGCA